jgi:hypothetical protein
MIRVIGCQVIRLPGYQVIRLSGYQVIRLPGCQVIRLTGSTLQQLLQHFNTSTLQHFNTSTLQHFNISTLQRFNNFNFLSYFPKIDHQRLVIQKIKECYPSDFIKASPVVSHGSQVALFGTVLFFDSQVQFNDVDTSD